MHLPDFSMHNIPEVKPISYEHSIFKRQADDIKGPIEQQMNTLASIAQSAHRQAESASEEVTLLKERLAFAKAEAESARKEAIFAKLISLAALLVSIAAIAAPLIFG